MAWPWLAVMWLVVHLAAGCGAPGVGDPLQARRGDRIVVSVVGVHDGDTLTGLTADRRQMKVRLEGIDAPELGQPFGKAAKRALSGKAFGRAAEIVVVSRDQYGRVVARVTVDGHDLGTALIREGHAWCDPRFNHDQRLTALERTARWSKVGLWADRDPTPPWEYRSHRGKKGSEPKPSGWWVWW